MSQGFTKFNNQFSIPITIAQGGTSAITASGARVNLSAAILGANNDITSMTGLTGALKAPTGILSSAGLNLFSFTYTASAVNYFSFTNNTTGSNPAIQAAGTDSNITLQVTGKGTGGVYLVGTGTNDNAVSMQVGEIISSVIASGSAVTVTRGAASDITNITLTAGDWDVWGNVTFPGVGTTASEIDAWVSSTSATIPDQSVRCGIGVTGIANGSGMNAPKLRFSLATTTTIYLTAFLANVSGNGTGCGGIYARRRR